MTTESVVVRVMNVASRVFGALCLIGAAMFLVGVVVGVDKILNMCIGIVLAVIGVLFLRVKTLSSTDVDRIRSTFR